MIEPYVTIDLNGQKNVRIDMYAVRAVEKSLGVGMPSIIMRMMQGDVVIDHLVVVITAGCQAYNRYIQKLGQRPTKAMMSVTEDTVTEDLQTYLDVNGGMGLAAIVKQVIEALNIGFGEGPKNEVSMTPTPDASPTPGA